ncbi:MAG: hypothetical protein JNK05_13615 [Myxococcales bacterium]|nr:hypothetical protein [Myxococcales bacterium]
MPVLEEDAASEPLDAQPLPRAWERHDQSSPVRVTLVREDGTAGLIVNERAARALQIEHAWTVAQERLASSRDVAREWSPEEKLLHAIFGEKSDSVAVDGLDDEGLPSVGATIVRGQQALCDPRSRAKVHFTEADSGEVRSVERVREGLAATVQERVIVTVTRTAALSIGDTLVCDGISLGVVSGVRDDGADEPRIYGPFETATREALASIASPSALVQCEPSADASQPGIVGERIASALLASLASRGCLALVTDFASHHCDASPAMYSVRESLMQRGTIEHPFSSATVAPAVTSLADKSIFDFFEQPKRRERSTASLDRAKAYARALGATLAHDGAALSLSLRGEPTDESEGEVTADLGDPRLFGPRKDYECECGALSRMKHRGVRCERCGVVVESSRVRAKLFAHIALREPMRHPWLDGQCNALAVLPPALRETRDPELERAYQRALDTRSAADAAAVHELLLARFCEVIRWPIAPLSALSGGAIAVVDPSLGPMHAVVPDAVMARMATPLLVYAAENGGFSTTVRGATQLLRDDPTLRAKLLEWFLQTRPLLLQRDDVAATQLCAVWTRDVSRHPVFRLGASLAESLGVRTGDRLVAHIALSDAAVRESVWLAEAAPSQRLRDVDVGPEGWVDELAFCAQSQRRSRFAEAVVRGASDPCATPNAAWLVGGYALDDDAGLVDRDPVPFIEPEVASSTTSELLDRSVDELELSVRTMNALQSLGIRTIGELVQRSESDLKDNSVAPRSIRELKELLSDMGLWLGMKG